MTWILAHCMLSCTVNGPPTPQCTDNQLYFYPSQGIATSPRSFDDGFHNDGPYVAILDLDGDGFNDIVQCFPREDTYIHTWKETLYLFDGCGAMAVEDLDRDGWDDLIVGREDASLDVIDILQNKEGTLQKKSSVVLGDDQARIIRTGDFNGDGLVDLFIAKNGFRDEMSDRDVVMYAQSTWEFSTLETALEEQRATRKAFDAIVMDIDQLGEPDIYVANDRGYEFGGNVLWLNRDADFLASENCACTPIQDAMGVDIADYNHDGFLDIITSDVHQTYLFEGAGNGEFINMTQARGANLMEDYEMSWGLRFVDVDNDGRTEIFSAQGDHTYEGGDFFEYIGDLELSVQTLQDDRFVSVEEQWGFTQQGSFRSIVPFHWNDDGVLDYWITDANNASVLMESNGCNPGNWLFIKGPSGTAVRFKAGDQRYYGEIHNASSYAASISPQIHFGLGSNDHITDLEIRYPNQSWQILFDRYEVPNKLQLSD